MPAVHWSGATPLTLFSAHPCNEIKPLLLARLPCRSLCMSNPISRLPPFPLLCLARPRHPPLPSPFPDFIYPARPCTRQPDLLCFHTYTHAHRPTIRSFNSLLSFIPCPDSRSNSILPSFDSSSSPRTQRTLAYPTPVDQSINLTTSSPTLVCVCPSTGYEESALSGTARNLAGLQSIARGRTL